MRIISGRWRKTPLPVLSGEGLRPTGNRLRETIFDWLGFILGNFEGRRSLDMFSGSGAMGLEFASRGGRSVLIEMNPVAARSLEAVRERLGAVDAVRVIRGDALSVRDRALEIPFDVVFIDPPFALRLHGAALERAAGLLATGGLICLETPSVADIPVPDGFRVLRDKTAGEARIRILAAETAEEREEGEER